jgi:hypothetical protein
MLHFGRLGEDEVSVTLHAVEVPVSSKMRQDFEQGKIRWTNFWSHSGWVIEFSLVLFSDEPVNARYVPFGEINPAFLKELRVLDGLGSPYKIHHDKLAGLCEFEKKYRPIETEHRDDYQDFILKYRSFLDETCIIRTEFLEFDIDTLNKKVA